VVVEPALVNILLVDDEPGNLTALAAVLEGPDRRLVFASSGEESLRHLLREDFAVILLDVNMPGANGFTTAELIRGRDKSKDTPIIFLTAETRDKGFVSRGYSLGAVDYIVKPFDPEALRSKVGVFVELFRKTEQVKQQATALAETTAFLNGVLESATEYAIAALDADGRFLTWNEGARRLYGYTADEMVGRGRLAMLQPVERPQAPTNGDAESPLDDESGIRERKAAELLRAATRRGKAEGTFEHVRKNGCRVPVAATVSQRLDVDGQAIGFLLVAKDITEEQHAESQRLQLIEEQAARSEAEVARDRLQQVVDVLPEGIVLVDASGQIYLSNAAADEIAGRELAVDPAAAFGEAGLFHLDGSPYEADELPLTRIIRQAEVVRGEQLLIPNPVSDRQVPVLINGAPLRDKRGIITGGVVVFQDITPIKELEAQKDAFLAAASHDLKNPLTSIKARAQILQRQVARMDSRERRKLDEGLHAIDQTATRLTAMINELLDVARLQMGRPLLLDRQATDLVALAQQVATELQPSTDRHDLVVESQTERTTGPWDRARLERVISNLVSNAIKFSPEGGRVTLVLRDEQQGAEAWAALEVRDEGIGIPPEDVPRIFERFYRGSNVQGAIEGTGLGLTGAAQIVQQHGGRLDVQSVQGQGSVFTLYLPFKIPRSEPDGLRQGHRQAEQVVGAGAP
jgi:signal transduction histidine kinase/DNA-binding response OmpR family regulator